MSEEPRREVCECPCHDDADDIGRNIGRAHIVPCCGEGSFTGRIPPGEPK